MVSKGLHNGQQGVALLEAMIAIVILSFGLIGLAGLQVASLKNNHIAYLRTVATIQAYDLADRVRAGMSTTAYAPVVNVNAGEVKDEVTAWNTVNARLLPSGSGLLEVLPTNRLRITVSWKEKCNEGESGCSSGSKTQSVVTELLP